MSNPRRYAALGVLGTTLAISYGIWYAYGVILVALLAEFGWSRSVLAGAFSVFTLVHGLGNPLMGMLCTRVRPLQVMAAGGAALGLALVADSFIDTPTELYLFFGVATAFAVCASGWVPTLVYVQREYSDRLGLSIGIVSAGVGVGMVLTVPLMQLLIDAYGWRAAFRWMGVLAVVWIVPSSLWLMGQKARTSGSVPIKEEPGKIGDRPQTEIGDRPQLNPAGMRRHAAREMTLAQAIRTLPFWLIFAACFFGSVCAQTLHVHQVVYLVESGLAAIVAASVVGAVGLASIFGKIGSGWLSDRMEREWVYAGGLVMVVASVLLLLALGAGLTHEGAYAYALLLGLGYSVTATLIPAMLSDRFSGTSFGAILGMGLLGSASGSALGPWIAGSLYDATGSYTVSFSIAAAAGVLGASSALYARALRRSAVGRLQ